MKPTDVKDNTYIGFGKEVNDNDPKFKAGDHVRKKHLYSGLRLYSKLV